ncbi:hypothetical protein SELMODRAFT_427977 [Selaginella moellendorffii]|uniref:Zinc finger RING-type eukaryotic domain-containing protein n=1 Tax=Selaginella moellendorffii TaxID=88036 RepID=D8T1B1_SELML|nr:hypothetical protein SELMODRAFT_427977 [Selaginella moellendorffii]
MADSDAPWPLLFHDAPAIACSLAAEIESNICPIFFELMKSPTYSPILLYPCGHTFCAKKLARDIADAQRKVVQLESREQETKVRLEKVNLEYHRVLSEMRENQDNLATLQKYQDEETAKVNLIQETLKNLKEKKSEKTEIFP